MNSSTRWLAPFTVALLLTACPGPVEPGADGGTDAGEVFDSGFVHLLPPGWTGQPMAAVAHGTSLMVVGNGTADGGAAALLVARVRADRTLDPSWNGTGVTLVDVAPGASPLFSSASAYAAMMDGDTLLIGGTAQALLVPGDGLKVVLARFSASGQLDTSFGNTGATTGVRLDGFGGATPIAAACTALVKQPDGKFLAGGHVQGNFFVTRYLATGTADVSFSKTPDAGFGAVWGTSRNEQTRSMVLDPDGNIVVFGGEGMSAARLLPTGALDTSFGTAGYSSSAGATGAQLWREANGSYLAVGFRGVTSDAGANQLAVRFQKLTTTGQPDTTFGTMGVQEVTLPGANIGLSSIRGAARLADGRVLLYVTGLGATYLVRFNTDFTLDQGFLEGGLPRKLAITLPLLQPASLLGQHLTVTAQDRWWVTDINLVVVDPRAPRSVNFFDVRTSE
ncbi:MAG: hypothetical protein Q8L14_17095 [Myxococcales bacterium]|nr:hypothetical protein [Myxococcales bacterium]